MRARSAQAALGLMAGVLGLMFAVQFRLQQVVPPPGQTNQLLTLLKQSEAKRAQLSQEVAHLNQLLDQRLSQQAAARHLENQLLNAEILAGTVAVSGPGIQITWSNGSAAQGYQISDIDLLLLVNELRAAGAEAIAINGQRITALTEIRQAGTYILINDSQQQAPFTIEAIGKPQTLAGALTLPGGLADQSTQEGRIMTIQTRAKLTLPAGSPPPVPYAHAAGA